MTDAIRAIKVTLIVIHNEPIKEAKSDWIDSKIMDGGGSKYHFKLRA
jgi:hypothetical protein